MLTKANTTEIEYRVSVFNRSNSSPNMVVTVVTMNQHHQYVKEPQEPSNATDNLHQFAFLAVCGILIPHDLLSRRGAELSGSSLTAGDRP